MCLTSTISYENTLFFRYAERLICSLAASASIRSFSAGVTYIFIGTSLSPLFLGRPPLPFFSSAFAVSPAPDFTNSSTLLLSEILALSSNANGFLLSKTPFRFPLSVFLRYYTFLNFIKHYNMILYFIFLCLLIYRSAFLWLHFLLFLRRLRPFLITQLLHCHLALFQTFYCNYF